MRPAASAAEQQIPKRWPLFLPAETRLGEATIMQWGWRLPSRATPPRNRLRFNRTDSLF